MARQAQRGLLCIILDLFSASKMSHTRKTKEEDTEDTSGEVAEVLGPKFDMCVSKKPHLLQNSQGSPAPCVRAPSQSLCEKPLQALFNYELDSKAELLLSRAREQSLMAALRTARLNPGNQGDKEPELFSLDIMRKSLAKTTAQMGLQILLAAGRDKANYSHTLLSVLGSLTSVLGEDCSPGTVNMEAVIRHPALQAAFQALVASTDEAVLSAAAEAILAAVSLSSSVDSPAKGAQSLATHLLRQATRCVPKLKSCVALAASGDIRHCAQAAALAKVLASVATINLIPLGGFLEGAASEPLIAALAVIRSSPAPEIAQESALFWRVLLQTHETALAWVQGLQLQHASHVVSLTRQPYIHLLDALFNSAVLPEHNWEDMGVMEQILALKRRTAIAEPLLEAAGVLEFSSCIEQLIHSCANSQAEYSWSLPEAVLACVKILHRASPSLGQSQLMALFRSLPELPSLGHLPVTMMETVRLYTPWAIALAKEMPEEGQPLLDVFNNFVDTGDVKGPRIQSELGSDTTSDWDSEYHSEASSDSEEDETESQGEAAATEQDLAGLTADRIERTPKRFSLFAPPCAAGEEYATEYVYSGAPASGEACSQESDEDTCPLSVSAYRMYMRAGYQYVFGPRLPGCLPEVSPCPQEKSAAECLRAFRSQDDSEAPELDLVSSLENEFPDISIADVSDADLSTEAQQDAAGLPAGEHLEVSSIECAPKRYCIFAPPCAVGEDSDASELDSASSPGDCSSDMTFPELNLAVYSDAESSTEPQEDDIIDTAGSAFQEKVDCMGSPCDGDFPLERQGSSTFPGPAELAEAECWPCSPAMAVFFPSPAKSPMQAAGDSFQTQSARTIQVESACVFGAPTSPLYQPALMDVSEQSVPSRAPHGPPPVLELAQVAPAAVIGVPSRPTYQPQLVHAPSSAAADAPLHFQCPALQALLTSAADSDLDAQMDSSAILRAPENIQESAAQGPSADEVCARSAVASTDVAAEQSPPRGPGSLIGRLYWTAGALVGTAAGLRKLLC